MTQYPPGPGDDDGPVLETMAGAPLHTDDCGYAGLARERPDRAEGLCSPARMPPQRLAGASSPPFYPTTRWHIHQRASTPGRCISFRGRSLAAIQLRVSGTRSQNRSQGNHSFSLLATDVQ